MAPGFADDDQVLAFAANARTAQALSRTRDPGPLPRYVAEALTTGGDKAKAEVADLLEQVAGRSPFMARKLRARVAALVGEKELGVFYGEGLLKRLAGFAKARTATAA